MAHPGALSAWINCIWPGDERLIVGIANFIKIYAATPKEPKETKESAQLGFAENASIRVFFEQHVRGVIPVENGHYFAYGTNQVTVLHRDDLAQGGSVPIQRVHDLPSAISTISVSQLSEVAILFRDGSFGVYNCTIDRDENIMLTISKTHNFQYPMFAESLIRLPPIPSFLFAVYNGCEDVISFARALPGTQSFFICNCDSCSVILAVSAERDVAARACENGCITMAILDEESGSIKSLYGPQIRIHDAEPTAIAVYKNRYVASGDESGVLAITSFPLSIVEDPQTACITRKLDMRRGVIRCIVASETHFYIGASHGPVMKLAISKLHSSEGWGEPLALLGEPMRTPSDVIAVVPNGSGPGDSHSLMVLDRITHEQGDDGDGYTKIGVYRSTVDEHSGALLCNLGGAMKQPDGTELGISEANGVVVVNTGAVIHLAVKDKCFLRFECPEPCVNVVAECYGGFLATYESGQMILLQINNRKKTDQISAGTQKLALPPGAGNIRITNTSSGERHIFAGTSDGRILHWNILTDVDKYLAQVVDKYDTPVSPKLLRESYENDAQPLVGKFISLSPSISSPITRMFCLAVWRVGAHAHQPGEPYPPDCIGFSADGHFFVIPDAVGYKQGSCQDLRSFLQIKSDQVIQEIGVTTISLVREKEKLKMYCMASQRMEELPSCETEEEARRVAWGANGVLYRVSGGKVYATPSLLAAIEEICEPAIYDDQPIVGAARIVDHVVGVQMISVSRNGQYIAQQFNAQTGKCNRLRVAWLSVGVKAICATLAEFPIKIAEHGKKVRMETGRFFLIAGSDGYIYGRELFALEPTSIIPESIAKLDGFKKMGVTTHMSATQISNVTKSSALQNTFFLAGKTSNNYLWCAQMARDDKGAMFCETFRILQKLPEEGQNSPTNVFLRIASAKMLQLYVCYQDGVVQVERMEMAQFKGIKTYYSIHLKYAVTAFNNMEYRDGDHYFFVGTNVGAIVAVRERKGKVSNVGDSVAIPHRGKVISALEARPHAHFICLLTVTVDGEFALCAFHREKLTIDVLWKSRLSISKTICVAAGYSDLASPRHNILALGAEGGIDVMPFCKKALTEYATKHGFSMNPPKEYLERFSA